MSSVRRIRGFTLIELMLVITIIAVASSLVVQALPNSAQAELEREAQRLQAHLNLARQHAQGLGVPIQWRSTEQGFGFGLATTDSKAEQGPASDAQPNQHALPTELRGNKSWLSQRIFAEPTALTLSPEPMAGAQRLTLFHRDATERKVVLSVE